jgi:histidyl-tRNA synthetase
LLKNVLFEGTNQEKLKFVGDFIGDNEGFENLKKIFEEVEGLEFSLTLARGLTYYTGTIYEFFLKDKELGISSSLGAGGRYDKMIGDFIGDGKEYPAVGVSFGLDVLSDVLKIKAEKENKIRSKTIVDIYVISIGCFDEAKRVVDKFRKGGLKTDIDILQRGIGKNLDYASKYGIPYVVFVGKKELEEKKIKLKDMVSGEEKLLTINDCFKFLKERFIP